MFADGNKNSRTLFRQTETTFRRLQFNRKLASCTETVYTRFQLNFKCIKKLNKYDKIAIFMTLILMSSMESSYPLLPLSLNSIKTVTEKLYAIFRFPSPLAASSRRDCKLLFSCFSARKLKRNKNLLNAQATEEAFVIFLTHTKLCNNSQQLNQYKNLHAAEKFAVVNISNLLGCSIRSLE
ncbi:CLUMA_CG003664, isoform A [Clunio marinus]|uniref:CLUMA_CG003664, isoform A n=1 Tax=Clunio marinus TaxID=568069 RepID=A0A1J1HTW8_9DIPT|nr:CLUMA_CG003664, isoform A [Clunio marinus]